MFRTVPLSIISSF